MPFDPHPLRDNHMLIGGHPMYSPGYKVRFSPPLTPEGKERCFRPAFVQHCADFAYKMTFGDDGSHRDHRSGGCSRRSQGHIFCDALQGKLSEFAVYGFLRENGFAEVSAPDMTAMPLGAWDICDIQVNGISLSVKSAKYYSNLLLLETRDYGPDGCYLPSNMRYPYILFVRIRPGLSKENMEYLQKQNIMDKNSLDSLFQSTLNNWCFDMPGFITADDFEEVIRRGHVIHQGDYLGPYTQMDADNYYVQSGDMRSIALLMNELLRQGAL